MNYTNASRLCILLAMAYLLYFTSMYNFLFCALIRAVIRADACMHNKYTDVIIYLLDI